MELVAVFDALDFLQLGRRAATLTRGGLVAERVTELEFFLGLFQFHVERGIERAERNGERFKSVGHKTDGLTLGSLLHKHGFVSLHAECATVAAVSRKLEILPSAPDRDLGKVGAACLDGATQVIRAGSLQGLSENLVAERVENFHLDGRGAALGVRKDSVAHANVSDRLSRSGGDSVGFIFLNDELSLGIRRGGLAFLEQVYRDSAERIALIVRNRTRDGVCRSHSAKSEKARRRKRRFKEHVYSFFNNPLTTVRA